MERLGYILPDLVVNCSWLGLARASEAESAILPLEDATAGALLGFTVVSDAAVLKTIQDYERVEVIKNRYL